MHVHTSYSLQLAEMGTNREEIHEIAVRRAAEVRRRLSSLAMFAEEDDDYVKATSASDSGSPADAYSPADEDPSILDSAMLDPIMTEPGMAEPVEPGTSWEIEDRRHFSALA